MIDVFRTSNDITGHITVRRILSIGIISTKIYHNVMNQTFPHFSFFLDENTLLVPHVRWEMNHKLTHCSLLGLIIISDNKYKIRMNTRVVLLTGIYWEIALR